MLMPTPANIRVHIGAMFKVPAVDIMSVVFLIDAKTHQVEAQASIRGRTEPPRGTMAIDKAHLRVLGARYIERYGEKYLDKGSIVIDYDKGKMEVDVYYLNATNKKRERDHTEYKL